MTDLVIAPTYNERGNIGTLIARVLRRYPAMHLLIVDDNSADGTADAVRALQTAYPNIRLLVRPGKLGFSSAYRDAFRLALAEIPDLRAVITMDTDLSHDPDAIESMLAKLDAYDVVVGSRYVAGGGTPDWTLRRRILSRFANFYARAVTGTELRDLTTGFVCYRADILRKVDLDALIADGFATLIEMKVRCERLGARIAEVPIVFADRTHGRSKLSHRIMLEGLVLPWRISRFRRAKD
ncbi:MAG: polyprenol monophosphomannose synthase [Alphaproteobacteria bacterium]